MSLEKVESLLLHCGVPYDQVDPTTWVLQLDNQLRSRVVVKVQEPIVLFSHPVGRIDALPDDCDREGLFRTLLELNTELLHSAYCIEDGRVDLASALQVENIDANEFQAVVDDLTMALDNHLETLSGWGLARSAPPPSLHSDEA